MIRFWKKVKKTDTCWVWTASKNQDGYGWFKINGKMRRAHRVSYEMHFGAPGELCVCHRCDNPGCVNPAHLFLGEHQDNMNDMVVKGRSNTRRGIANTEAKLTESAVKEIRELCNQKVKQRDIAELYGVSKSLISHIHRREGWSHV